MSDKAKHTPGEWRVREGQRQFHAQDKEKGRRDLYVCDSAGVGLWDDQGSVYEPADAALMAAAPELLEKLKVLVAECKEYDIASCDHNAGLCNCSMRILVKQCESAIALAEGGTE